MVPLSPAWRSRVAIGVALSIWAGNFVVMKVAVRTIDPFLVGALRTVLAGLVVLPVLVISRPLLPVGWAEWGFLAAGSIGNYVAFPILASFGLTGTTAARAALIFGAAPALTAFIGSVVMRDPISWRRALGIGMALAGVVLLVGPGVLKEAGRGGWRGDLLMFLATAGSSISYVAGAYLGRRIGTWGVVSYSMIGGSIPLMPFVVTIWRRDLMGIAPGDWVGIFYLAFLGTLLANALWVWALSRGSVVGVGTTQFLLPVLSVVMAAVFLGERLTWEALACGLTILAGVRLIQVP